MGNARIDDPEPARRLATLTEDASNRVIQHSPVRTGGRVNAPTTDVHRVLTYTDSRVAKVLLFASLALFALGLVFISTYSKHDPNHMAGWVMGFAGLALALAAHFKLFKAGTPLLVLSPRGLVLSSVGKDVFIPWTEVRGVERVSFRSWTAMTPVPVPVSFNNVTAVLISRDFYEDEVVSAYPTLVHHRVWSRTFRSHGDNLIQVCLHHDLLPAKSEELRREVAARWYAFREQDKTAAPEASDRTPAATPPIPTAPAASKPKRAKMRDKVRFLVRWGKKPS